LTPLAKLWSWTGQAFILFAIGWAVFVRGGLSDKSLPEGVAISQGYWALVVALITANVLVWTFGLYVRAARRDRTCENSPLSRTGVFGLASGMVSPGATEAFSQMPLSRATAAFSRRPLSPAFRPFVGLILKARVGS
jgi:phosphoglycerol transferase MdoB-like AlkP superfamily enzyme